MVGSEMITLNKKTINNDATVFVIAEIGCNFEDSFERAKEMVVAAAKAGADAVKFQTFIPEKLVTRTAEKFWEIEGCPGNTQFEEFKAMFQPNFEQYQELKQLADKNRVLFFSTPSDEDSADMLEKLGVQLYKISSMDITHLPLVRYIARKKKPIILSTGASTIDEIREAVETIESEGNTKIAILHCTTNYPTKIENVNLNMIKSLIKEFPKYVIGYSDHTKMPESTSVLVGAVALGAKIIEKHFTFDRSRPGYDHEISADYSDLKVIVDSIRTIEISLGAENKKPIPSERKARRFARRSIVAEFDIPAGAILTKDMISVKRPGGGIEPKFFDQVIGKKAKKNIKRDDVILWDLLT